MNKTWQIVIFLGIFCLLFTITQYIITMKNLGTQKEFQQASEKIKKKFDLQKITIVRFQRPEEYRIVVTPKAILTHKEALATIEKIGLFFKTNCVPFSAIRIKILHIKEISQGCSSQVIKVEKILEPYEKIPQKIFLQEKEE